MSRLRHVVNVAILALGAGIIWYERSHSRPEARSREHVSGPEARDAFVSQATQVVSQATSVAQSVASTVQQVSTEAAPHVQAAAGAAAATLGGVAAVLRPDQTTGAGEQGTSQPEDTAAQAGDRTDDAADSSGDEPQAGAPDIAGDVSTDDASLDGRTAHGVAGNGRESDGDQPVSAGAAEDDGGTSASGDTASGPEARSQPSADRDQNAADSDTVSNDAARFEPGASAEVGDMTATAMAAGDALAATDAANAFASGGASDPASSAMRRGTILETPEATVPGASNEPATRGAGGGFATSEGSARAIGRAAQLAPDAALSAPMSGSETMGSDHLAAAADRTNSSSGRSDDTTVPQAKGSEPDNRLTAAGDDAAGSAGSVAEASAESGASELGAAEGAGTAPVSEARSATVANDAGQAPPVWTPADAVHGDGSATCPDAYPVKGNASSRIYHEPGRASYERTIPEFCFASTEAAERAGFRAPKH